MRRALRLVLVTFSACLAISSPTAAQPTEPASDRGITPEQIALCLRGKDFALDFYRALLGGWEADGKLIAIHGLYSLVRRAGPRLLIGWDQAWGVDLKDNTDICAAHDWDISGRQHRIRTYYPVSQILAVGHYAKETVGLYLFRLHDGAQVEIDGGQELIESPDGQWLAVVEWDMGVEPAVSLWETGGSDLRLYRRLSDATSAWFYGPTRLVVTYRDRPATALSFRNGAWVEDPNPP